MNKITDSVIVETLLKDHESRHSDFQIENFIIKKQGDAWAQYKQCLREISSRHESITGKENRARDISAGIKKSVRFKLWRFLNRKRFAGNGSGPEIKSADGNTKDLKAELACLLKIAQKLKEEIGEVTEEKRYQLETKSWAAKGLKMAAIDLMASGRISNQTYDFLFALPKDSMVDIIKELSSKKPMELLGFEPIP